MVKFSDTSIVDGITYRQTDFLSALDNSVSQQNQTNLSSKNSNPPTPNTPSERHPLPRNQQMGFRKDYEDAKITLYIIGVLLNSEQAKLNAPEEIKKELEHAKKVQARYERYMPNASQSLIHFGREVVDAYTCGNRNFLNEKEEEAYNEAQSVKKKLQKKGKTLTGLSQKQRMFRFSINKIEKIISIIQQHNI